MYEIVFNAFELHVPYMLTIGIFFVLDTITGLAKTFYKKNYESSKAKKGFSKLLVYICLTLACIFLECLINYSGYNIHFSKIVSISIILVEFSSIIENFEIITGKNIITELANKIFSNLKNIVKKGDEANE